MKKLLSLFLTVAGLAVAAPTQPINNATLTGTTNLGAVGTIDNTTGNISTAGGVTTGAGGTAAGYFSLGQGTAASTGTTNITFYAPTSVTSYKRVFAGTVGSTGFPLYTVSGTTQTESLVAGTGTGNVVLATTPTVTTPTIASGAAITSNSGLAAGVPSVILSGSSDNERYEAQSFGGGTPVFSGVGAGGTVASPTRSTLNLILWAAAGGGYDNAGTPAIARSKGTLNIIAAEDWTTSAQGTRFVIRLTPTGSTTRRDVAAFTAAGNLVLDSGATETGLSGSGGLRLASTTEATTGGAASLITLGGIYATKAIISGSATASTSTTTGSGVFAGGIGVAGNSYFGGTLNVTGAITGGNIVEKIAVFSVDGAGSAITTGTVSGTARIPFGCTLTGWSITATGATGTNTIKIWNAATGTAIPTIANVINTSGISLTTGTAVKSTTLTDFTDTTYAADDMMRCAVTAVDGTATDLTVTLYGTRL